MLSCSISELLGKRTAQCPRFKRCWKAYEMLNSDNFVRSWARSLVHFLDFATRIPCFNKMAANDKRSWFINRFVPCTLVSMAFHSSVERRDGLLFGCSNVFPYRLHEEIDNKPEDLLCKLFNTISEQLFSFVVHPMLNLNFSEHHFALLKACVLYSPGLHFFHIGDESRDAIIAESNIHRNALMKLILNDITSFDEKADILFQINDMCSAIERATRHFDNEIKCLHLMGVPIAQKRMIIEFHVRK
ncbi:unnamed protein product [Caenorhabditis angaria]|uniref:NR LBD domain-containing protein n=1 Tax=Caenorhabditis angaria TaxID=860376 RepID=A0A9P1N5M4_9PELO|nr:unnamed protein product [Caenorhabditis angaria]